MLRSIAMAGVVAVLASIGGGGLWATGDAKAAKRATAAQSRAIWKVVDSAGRCVHRRARISTVRPAGFTYGLATIGDSTCGDGKALVRRKGQGGWRVVETGSDWGLAFRCREDVARFGLPVLRDLFGSDFCAQIYGASARRAGGGR